jgi:hypothetical protein
VLALYLAKPTAVTDNPKSNFSEIKQASRIISDNQQKLANPLSTPQTVRKILPMSKKKQVPFHPIMLGVLLTVLLITLIAEFFIFKTTVAFIGLILIPVLTYPFALYVVWNTPKGDKRQPSNPALPHHDDAI